MGDLNAIRRTIRAKRKKIAGEERRQLSEQAAEQILFFLSQNPQYQQIASFLSLLEEIDTTPLHQALFARGYSLYLPHVTAKNCPLTWLPFAPETPLFPDQAGVLSPAFVVCPSPVLDVVIMPLVAVDSRGTRLGMGGGFYDRSFQGRISGQSPKLIGIAYPCQFVSSLPRRHWDIPVDACAVAEQFFYFSH